jgi:hypothetical protein
VTPAETLLLARRQAVRPSRSGDNLLIVSDEPPPSELMAALRENKPALLAMVLNRAETSVASDDQAAWNADFAGPWLQAMPERIGAWHDDFGSTCPVDDPEWERHEDAVNAAYAAQDLHALRSALEDYERFALTTFMATASSRPPYRPPGLGPRACPDCKCAAWRCREDGGHVCGVCHPDPGVTPRNCLA